MHRIEITGETMAELVSNVLALASSMSGASNVAVARANPVKPKAEETFDAVADAVAPQEEQAEAAPAETKSPPRRTRTARTAPADAAPAAEAAPAEEKAPARSSPKAEPEVTEATLRNLVLKLMQAKGREKVEAILSTFGIARATEVDASRAAELVTAFEDAIAA